MTKEELEYLNLDIYEFQDKFKTQIDKFEITEEMKPYLFKYMYYINNYNKALIEYNLRRIYMNLLEFTYIPENQIEAFAYMLYNETCILDSEVLASFEYSKIKAYEERYEKDFNGLMKDIFNIDEDFLREIYESQVEYFTWIHPDIKISHEYDQYLFDPETVLTDTGIKKYIRRFMEYP